jgi:hypothetical protein
MRVAGYCEKVLAHQDKRAFTYTSYSEQLAKLKLSKDINAFLVRILELYFERDTFNSVNFTLILSLEECLLLPEV